MQTILHLIPTLEGGGAERQLAMLATEQASRDWSVHVALLRGGVHEERMRNGAVAIHQLGDLRSVHPLLVSRVGALVGHIRPDVLQTWLPQMDLVGGVVALFKRVPWVLSERASKEAYQRRPALAWMRTRLARYAKAVVANSVDGAKYWNRMLPKVESVATVANAVDVAAIRLAAPMACEATGEGATTFLFVGRLVHQKAPEILIQAVRHLPEHVRALLIGDGLLRQQVYASITAYGLENRVSIKSYHSDWWGFLKTASALVSPSRFEGQPNVVLEAMAAGCPLIVSDIPAHRAILDEGSALIVPRDNPAALANAILSLVADPEAARRRAERASERMAGFTIQAAADAYERVYSKVVIGRTV